MINACSNQSITKKQSQTPRTAQVSSSRHFAVLQNHKVSTLSFWKVKLQRFDTSKGPRFFKSTSEIDSYCYHLRLATNSKKSLKCNGQTNISPFSQALESSLYLLPNKIKNWLNKKVYAVILVDDVNFDYHLLNLQKYIYHTNQYVLFLNKKTFHTTINDWYLERESSITQDISFLKVEFSDDILNKSEKIIQHIQLQLLRVFALIINNEVKAVPTERVAETNFTKLSWSLIDKAFLPKHQIDIPEYFSLSYSKKFSNQNIDSLNKSTYIDLCKFINAYTNFLNPYASITPLQDFTESLTFYIHQKILFRPINIQTTDDQGLVSNLFLNTFNNKEKTEYFDKLYSNI